MDDPKVFPTLSADDVARLRLCRICRGADTLHHGDDGFPIPFVLNYGKEYAHRDCIERIESMGYVLPEYRNKSMS
jgi:hypothetical protein